MHLVLSLVPVHLPSPHFPGHAEQRHALVNLNSATQRCHGPAQCRPSTGPNLSARSSTKCFQILSTIVPKRNQRIQVAKQSMQFPSLSFLFLSLLLIEEEAYLEPRLGWSNNVEEENYQVSKFFSV